MSTWQAQLNVWRNRHFVKELLTLSKNAELYLVGGAVRDAILGRDTQDFDFVVRNVSPKILERFLSQRGAVSHVGKRFGVFKFKPRGSKERELDIALPRTEQSLTHSGAYKDFVVSSDPKLPLLEDLQRRDFTINAMAWDLKNQQLIDPYDGITDIGLKNIRTVGNPDERFAEDFSRLLRAIRFAVQLDFDFDRSTWKSVVNNHTSINTISDNVFVIPREVVANELIKMMRANPLRALTLLEHSGMLELLMPELYDMRGCPQPEAFHQEGDVWEHTLLALKQLESRKFVRHFDGIDIPHEVIWALLFHDIGKPHTLTNTDRLRFNNHDNVSAQIFLAVADRLKLSAAGLDVEMVATIIRKHMLLAHADMTTIKQTTLEKYFFNSDFPGTELRMVMYADLGATIHAKGTPDYSDYRKLQSRITALSKKIVGRRELPKPLLDGHELMKEFEIQPGKHIGELLELLREAQLSNKVKTKKDALLFIKRQL